MRAHRGTRMIVVVLAYPSMRRESFTAEFNRYSWIDLTWNYWQRQNNALKKLLIKIRPMDFTPGRNLLKTQATVNQFLTF